MEQDEEVIVEGSPLYSHLLESGFSEFDTIKSQNGMPAVHNIQNELGSNSQIEKNYRYYGSKLWQFLLQLLGIQKIDENSIKYCAKQILEKKVFYEQDLVILEGLLPNLIDPDDESTEIQSDYLQKFSCTSYLKSPIICVIFSILAIFVIRLCNGQMNAIFQTLYIFMILGIMLLLRWSIIKRHKNSHEKMNQLTLIMSKLNKVVLKSQKLLNEMIFIEKNLPKDYKFGYKDSIYSAHCILVEKVLKYTADRHQMLWASCELEQKDAIQCIFEPRFTTQMDKSSMQAQRYQINLQLSGLLCEVFIQIGANYNQFHRLINLIFDYDAFKSIDKSIDFLNDLIKLNERFWTHKENRNTYKSQLDVYTMADNVSVRCKISTERTCHLLTKLQEHEKAIDEATDTEVFRYLITLCDAIEADLISSMGCLGELQSRLSKRFNPTIPEIPTSLSLGKPATIATPIEPPELVQDEFYELFIEKDNIESDTIVDSYDVDGTVKNQCNFVLKEIQPILRQRRHICEKREENALKRNQNTSNLSPLGEGFENLKPKYELNTPSTEVSDLRQNNSESLASQNDIVGDSVIKPELEGLNHDNHNSLSVGENSKASSIIGPNFSDIDTKVPDSRHKILFNSECLTSQTATADDSDNKRVDKNANNDNKMKGSNVTESLPSQTTINNESDSEIQEVLKLVNTKPDKSLNDCNLRAFMLESKQIPNNDQFTSRTTNSDSDSEEESLRRYKLVKAELDEDEASRESEDPQIWRLPDIKSRKFVKRPVDNINGQYGLFDVIGSRSNEWRNRIFQSVQPRAEEIIGSDSSDDESVS